MTRLRTPARLACWIAALAMGGPWIWLAGFVWERHPHESLGHVLVRAKLHANLWLLTGGVVWYLGWSLGTLLLPRHAAAHRHAHPLHRRLDAAIVLLIPAVGVLFFLAGDPDPRHFRRMMPGDWVFLPAVLLAALQTIVCLQTCYLERLPVPAPTSVPEPGCPAGPDRFPAVSERQRQGRGGWRGWRRRSPPQSAGPHRTR